MIKGLNLHNMLGYNFFLHNICGYCCLIPIYDVFVPKPVATGLDQFLAVLTGSSLVFLGLKNF
jgi:hypothetical protein